MSKPLAVVGLTLAHGAGSTITGGLFTVVSLPSVTTSAEGKKVFKEKLQYTFAGGTTSVEGFLDGSVIAPAEGEPPMEILPTALKCKADGALVMREGDFGVMTGEAVIEPPPPVEPFTAPAVGPVEIAVAGQTKVLGK